MEQALEKLFESVSKVRILRMFMQNSSQSFTTQDISKRTQLKPRIVKRELSKLMNIGLIKIKTIKIRKDIHGKKSIAQQI